MAARRLQAGNALNLRMSLSNTARQETAPQADLAGLFAGSTAQARLGSGRGFDHRVGNNLRGVAGVDPFTHQVFAACAVLRIGRHGVYRGEKFGFRSRYTLKLTTIMSGVAACATTRALSSPSRVLPMLAISNENAPTL